jgi:hypothetical protein
MCTIMGKANIPDQLFDLSRVSDVPNNLNVRGCHDLYTTVYVHAIKAEAGSNRTSYKKQHTLF